MLKLFVSYFSPFCKNYFLATFERFNKNFTQNKKKKKVSSRLQRFVFMVIQFWTKGVHL